MTDLYEHATGLLEKWQAEGRDLGDHETTAQALRWWLAYRQAELECDGNTIRAWARVFFDGQPPVRDYSNEDIAEDLTTRFDSPEDVESDLREFFGVS